MMPERCDCLYENRLSFSSVDAMLLDGTCTICGTQIADNARVLFTVNEVLNIVFVLSDVLLILIYLVKSIHHKVIKFYTVREMTLRINNLSKDKDKGDLGDSPVISGRPSQVPLIGEQPESLDDPTPRNSHGVLLKENHGRYSLTFDKTENVEPEKSLDEYKEKQQHNLAISSVVKTQRPVVPITIKKN
ncbi:hypothetical protein EIN_320470 [Entamoeba invadens IP1]|uniref:Uncharacterized protein n=1 Tax=Entamoeba invadens IP1 TaxID=370355 RepID=A0A0A1U2Z9_ENTIV|nr:hypothetical protein EIN_320470 [Entamoeba invadens IP1]ELP87048.1 hypothetical protein EIN_320470 [Entamoeba invadens IP1]|eukprot:XP_004253819.1 hypothetical protein EIN_320470 [Entamoeba invadens IP1]